MGMAASQARYLGLTARKTNVEYEGQQINQARTALANQSANTFNELLSLDVPTAPSTQDYTKLQYSYTDGVNQETITDMSELINDPDGYNYLISHYHYADVFTGVKTLKTNPQVGFGTKAGTNIVSKDNVTYDSTSKTYTVNGKTLTQYDPTDEAQKATYSQIVNDYPDFSKFYIEDLYTYTDDDGKLYFASKTDLNKASNGSSDLPAYTVNENVPSNVGINSVLPYNPLDSEMKAAYEQVCRDFPAESISSSDNIYTWTSQGKTYFATLEDLQATYNSAPDQTKPTENQNKLATYNAENVKTKIEQKQRAFVDLDDSGRPNSIRYEDSSVTYALNTESITDENAYNDAMNQYNYDMQVYEKKIADINAKTEKIQQQDRTLELRLKQLDTEQEALQTEMEAVKKVIEKNIESTFKTFE